MNVTKDNLIPISTLFNSKCGLCKRTVSKGFPVLWDKESKSVYHYECVGSESDQRIILVSNHIFSVLFEKKNYYLESLVRQIAGATFDGRATWYIDKPTPVSAKQLLDLAEEYNFQFDGHVLTELADIIKSGTETLLDSMAHTSSFEVRGLKHEPFPFQVKGIEFAINNRHLVIADQMGLGKTIQAMGVISHLGLYPVVIVCPAIIKLNWLRELLNWIYNIHPEEITILEGRTPTRLVPYRFYIINYDILPEWTQELQNQKPRAIIFDEFHYVKNGKSKRSKAAYELAKDKEYVLGLTGTPVLNRPEELIHPLKILGRLKEMGGRGYFEKRYCDAHRDNFKRWNISGASNLKELNERLRSNGILIRRLKTEVLPDLPRKLPPTVIPLHLTNRSEYLKAERDLARWLSERAIEDETFKQSISHLPPLAQIKATSARKSSVEYLARRNEARTRFIYLKRLSTEGKIAGVKEHINNFLESGEKLLVFGWFVDTQIDLTVTWPAAVHALGQDSDKERASAIDKFQSDPNCQLMIASLKVLGIGVNLTAASHVAFIELGWTPADHEQAEDRIHRIGQTMPVNIYYYVGVDTIEQDIIEIIDRKRKIINEATDGNIPIDTTLTDILTSKLLLKYGTSK